MVMKVTVLPDLGGGDVDEGYGKLADVFRRHMTSGEEIEGRRGRLPRRQESRRPLGVAIATASLENRGREDTIVDVFSTTKGVAGLSVALAASRGLISYDAKVAD